LDTFGDADCDDECRFDAVANFAPADTRLLVGRFTARVGLRAAFAAFDFGLLIGIWLYPCVNDSIMCCHWHGPADRDGR
jgi:hypothetical protein